VAAAGFYLATHEINVALRVRKQEEKNEENDEQTKISLDYHTFARFAARRVVGPTGPAWKNGRLPEMVTGPTGPAKATGSCGEFAAPKGPTGAAPYTFTLWITARRIVGPTGPRRPLQIPHP
jgi:hypothetical protein